MFLHEGQELVESDRKVKHAKHFVINHAPYNENKGIDLCFLELAEGNIKEDGFDEYLWKL